MFSHSKHIVQRMCSFMDSNLINLFRDFINDDDLIYTMYHDCDGKNKWNIICSSMDWIEVAIDGINPKQLSFKNDNASSIKFMSFVMCVDLLWEAIKQLHRVIFNTASIPFKNEKGIFKSNQFSSSDNTYFKTVRACFAAHPVNIHDYFSSSENKERRYASWSGGGFRGKSFSVILYSNIPDKEDFLFDINPDELIRFAEKRYQYIYTLMGEIARQKEAFIARFKALHIPRSNVPLEQINILIAESHKRTNNSYYSFELKKLQLVFGTSITSTKNLSVVNQYREALVPEVEELFQALQNMEFKELESEDHTDFSLPSSCRYDFSKLCEHVFGDGYCFRPNIQSLKDALWTTVNLDEIGSYEEMYVVVLSGFFVMNGDT